MTAPRRLQQTIRRGLLAVAPPRWLVASGPAGAASVCLTFDDGPDPDWTDRTLDVLAAEDVRATFFVQGSRAAARPDLIRRIHREGHTIGHHSWWHSPPAQTTALQLAAEVKRTQAWLRTAVGVEATLFRPPHGKLTAAKLVRLWAARQTIVLWSADPGDVFQRDAADIVAWFDAYPPAAGDIILLHDRCAASVAALPTIIARVRARGLGFASVSDWIAGGRRPSPRHGARA